MQGIEQINELFDGLDVIAETAGKVYQDKKIDVADLPHAIEMLVKAETLMEAFKGLSQIKEEAKDLQSEEMLVIATRMIQVGNKYEAARKGA
tara:strand:+ start:45111 stop:45386 length:276 start_codon:yes stop_codon:yes gene_type:complete